MQMITHELSIAAMKRYITQFTVGLYTYIKQTLKIAGCVCQASFLSNDFLKVFFQL